MRTPARFALTLALAAGFALTLTPTAAIATALKSDVSDFTFDSFDADYTLSREADGTATLDVVETIVARFPDFDQNRGIIRAIPDDYDGVPLNTRINGVTDANGDPVFFESYPSGDFVELALGTDEFVRGVQTYVISYTQQNVVRSFDDTASDEFYWDVNGTGWQQPFGEVSATVTLAPDVAEALTGNAACYVGAFGEDEQCMIDEDGTTFTASAADLAPGETVTVAIGFEPDTFLTPEPTQSPPGAPNPAPQPVPWWMHVLSGAIGVASIGALVAAIVSRVRAGSGAKGRGVIIPQYSEPDGIDILQSAHLVGRSSAGVPAAVVRLAVRRNLRILAYAVEKDGAPYTLQFLTDDRADSLDLAMLDAIFGADRAPGDLKEYGKYDSGLASRLNTLSTAANTSLVPEGFKRKPPGRGFGGLMLLAQWLLLVLAFGAVVVSSGLFMNVSPLAFVSMLVAFIAGLVALVLAIRPLQFTEKGREARDHLEGMKLYLTVAEQDRLRMLQSPQGAERIDVGDELELVKLYEKLLPWAVVWGVEDQWMRELELHVAALDDTPDWFVGRSGFEVALFASAVRGMTATTTAPASSSSWSGSGGGSFSGGSFGGGFSGGGGGGGGGGGR
ncbi:MAG: DUF2207 domain-containing protein [Microcella pacifica]|uniref:DUF2207 domain-containing protein n=1 Tax=Microcella pacifica TaxID=2591847 RepID=UPI003315EA67